MRTNIIIFSLLFCLSFAVACTSTTDRQVEFEQQIAEINAIHDEVMPRMAELNMLDEVMTDSLNTASKAQRVKFSAAKEKIKQADSMMMTWMQNFIPGKERTEDEQAAYLKQELESVQEMKAVFLDAIETATKLKDGQ